MNARLSARTRANLVAVALLCVLALPVSSVWALNNRYYVRPH